MPFFVKKEDGRTTKQPPSMACVVDRLWAPTFGCQWAQVLHSLFSESLLTFAALRPESCTLGKAVIVVHWRPSSDMDLLALRVRVVP